MLCHPKTGEPIMSNINAQNGGYDLSRFINAQQRDFKTALAEIKSGQKRTHWIWYIFPQLGGLIRNPSSTSQYYAIADIREARAFLADAYLGGNIREISNALLELDTNYAYAVVGRDSVKLQSSMTLFAAADENETVFKAVLDKFFNGRADRKTLRLLGLE
mgnify:FL=1